jgi:thiamine biosynthesis protein ThiS
MNVMVNGDPMDLPSGFTVGQLLEQLKLKPELVVVDLNLEILPRAQVAQTVLKEGDKIEIVHFVGGGSGWATGQPSGTVGGL